MGDSNLKSRLQGLFTDLENLATEWSELPIVPEEEQRQEPLRSEEPITFLPSVVEDATDTNGVNSSGGQVLSEDIDTLAMRDVVKEPDSVPLQPTDHPLFRSVGTLINQGNWRAALVSLAELQALYPDDAYLKEVAASLRTRSALLDLAQETTSAPPRTSSLRRRLKFIVLGAVGILLLSFAAVALLALVLPRATIQRQETRINQFRQEARAALASGDYDRAVLAYTELLKLLPDDREAKDGLGQASQLRATVSLYSEAIAAMEAHHWEDALSLLRQIQAKQPGYRDVEARIVFVQEQQDLLARFNEAEKAFERGDYELAIQAYEALQATDYGFQREAVQDHLFLSYLQLGLAEEAAAGSDPQRLKSSLDRFEKALALRPGDSQAKGESQLLRLYIAGLDQFEAGNWEQVVADLTPVYQARPDFANGTAAQHLYQAQVAWADDLVAKGEIEQALAKYEEARLIRGADATELDQKIGMAKETLVTPTLTLEPSENVPTTVSAAAKPAPTATPRPLPYALKGMSVKSNCGDFGYIHGIVWSAYNLPMAGVTIQALNTTTGFGPLTSLPTNQDGIYQIILEKDKIDGLWAVQVVENGQPGSQAWGQHLGGGCVNGAQELKVDWQRTLETQ